MNYLTTKQKEYSKGGILQAPSIKDGQTNGGYVVYRDNLADEDGVIDLLRDDIYYDSSTGGAVRVEKIQPQKAAEMRPILTDFRDKLTASADTAQKKGGKPGIAAAIAEKTTAQPAIPAANAKVTAAPAPASQAGKTAAPTPAPIAKEKNKNWNAAAGVIATANNVAKVPGAVLDYDKAAVKRNDWIDKTGSQAAKSTTIDDVAKQFKKEDKQLFYNIAKKLQSPYANKIVKGIGIADLSVDIINEYVKCGRIDKSTAKELTKYMATGAGTMIISNAVAGLSAGLGLGAMLSPVGALAVSAAVVLFLSTGLEMGIDGIDKWITSGQAEEYLQGVMNDSMERYNKECAELKAQQERIARENEWHKYEEKVSAEGIKQMKKDLAAAATKTANTTNKAMASVANKNISKMTTAEQKQLNDLVGLGQMSQQIANNAMKNTKPVKSKNKQKSKGWF